MCRRDAAGAAGGWAWAAASPGGSRSLRCYYTCLCLADALLLKSLQQLSSLNLHFLPPQLTVTPDVDSPGLLLNIASVIHGMGISVTQGVIRSPGPLAPAGGGAVSSGDDAGTIAAVAPAAAGRVMRFHLQEARSGRKLDYESASGLLLALQLVSGRGAPTALPTVSRANDCGCS